MNARYRPILYAAGVMLLVWLVVWASFAIAGTTKVTAEKVQSYLKSTDLKKLSGEKRAKALRELAEKLNALSPEERRKARAEHLWAHWFEQMTEQEKSDFIEATLPTGFKQMLSAFEQLPEERRRQAVDDAVKRLRQANNSGGLGRQRDPKAPPVSEELQRKAAAIGLQTFFSQSSAQTKAELAPLLEELQKAMESGRLFHQRPH